jgi:hypothetical protein
MLSPEFKKVLLLTIVQGTVTYFIMKYVKESSVIKKLDKQVENENNN